MITIEFEGIEALRQSWQRLQVRVGPAVAHALKTEADQILEASFPLVPVDSTLLILTGMVEGPTASGQETRVDIRYGGHGLAPYAIVQHENTTFNHPNGGQHHFLSEPVFTATGGMAERLGALIGPALRG
jgi:hypothetical protein